MKAIYLIAALLGIVAIAGCSGRTQAVSETGPQMINEVGSSDAATDELRKACLSGSVFGKGHFEQGACHSFR